MATEQKKRGRKKKWDNYQEIKETIDDKITFNNSNNYSETGKNISFGNLNIQIHSSNNTQPIQFKNIKAASKAECLIIVDNSAIDQYNMITDTIINNNSTKICTSVKNKSHKILHYFKNEHDKGREINNTDILCYYCCHQFYNKPYFLPFDYCPKLKRYKLFGNFCSPNCVKAYALNSVIFKNKLHIISQMYRELFGRDFKIKPAPNILTLKCFGGFLTIEKFRENFHTNVNYSIKKIDTKIENIEIFEK